MEATGSARTVVRVIAVALTAGLFAGAVNAAPPAGVPAGNPLNDILARLDEINGKLDRVEKRLGCPIDEYIAGTCTDNPAGTTVTYCVSQERGIEVAGKYAVEPKAKLEGGGRWDVVGLVDLHGEVQYPLVPFLGPVPLPIPTELALAASGGHGKGFDICVEIPLRAATADAGALERIVKGINPPAGAGNTRYQRRLSRLLNYAERRVPEPVSATAAQSAAPAAVDFDLDALDEAAEALMAGRFQPFSRPLGLFKDPIVQAIRNNLELPEPLHQVLDDPDLLLAALPSFSVDSPAQLCATLGLSGDLASRSPAIAKVCNLLGALPSFYTASSAFSTAHRINTLLADLPDEIIFGVGDILTNVNAAKLPTPRPPGSSICNVFPRLCR